MEKNESSLDILKNIAKRENWEINIGEQKHSVRHGYSKRLVIIKNPEIPQVYFISVQTPNMDKYRIYSGIFSPINISGKYKLLIKNRNVLDKISFRKNRKRFKTGNSSFDSKINIVTNHNIETHKIFGSSKVQMEVLKFMKRNCGLHIGFNEINPDFNEELKGKNFLSLFITMEWMLEKEMIDAAFNLAKILRDKFN